MSESVKSGPAHSCTTEGGIEVSRDAQAEFDGLPVDQSAAHLRDGKPSPFGNPLTEQADQHAASSEREPSLRGSVSLGQHHQLGQNIQQRMSVWQRICAGVAWFFGLLFGCRRPASPPSPTQQEQGRREDRSGQESREPQLFAKPIGAGAHRSLRLLRSQSAPRSFTSMPDTVGSSQLSGQVAPDGTIRQRSDSQGSESSRSDSGSSQSELTESDESSCLSDKPEPSSKAPNRRPTREVRVAVSQSVEHLVPGSESGAEDGVDPSRSDQGPKDASSGNSSLQKPINFKSSYGGQFVPSKHRPDPSFNLSKIRSEAEDLAASDSTEFAGSEFLTATTGGVGKGSNSLDDGQSSREWGSVERKKLVDDELLRRGTEPTERLHKQSTEEDWQNARDADDQYDDEPDAGVGDEQEDSLSQRSHTSSRRDSIEAVFDPENAEVDDFLGVSNPPRHSTLKASKLTTPRYGVAPQDSPELVDSNLGDAGLVADDAGDKSPPNELQGLQALEALGPPPSPLAPKARNGATEETVELKDEPRVPTKLEYVLVGSPEEDEVEPSPEPVADLVLAKYAGLQYTTLESNGKLRTDLEQLKKYPGNAEIVVSPAALQAEIPSKALWLLRRMDGFKNLGRVIARTHPVSQEITFWGTFEKEKESSKKAASSKRRRLKRNKKADAEKKTTEIPADAKLVDGPEPEKKLYYELFMAGVGVENTEDNKFNLMQEDTEPISALVKPLLPLVGASVEDSGDKRNINMKKYSIGDNDILLLEVLDSGLKIRKVQGEKSVKGKRGRGRIRGGKSKSKN